MKRLGLMLFGIALLASCEKDPPPPASVCDGALECTRSNQCNPGDFCENFCCAPARSCLITGCPEEQTCNDQTDACEPASQACLGWPAGCECHIVSETGRVEPGGDPTVRLAQGASIDVTAVLALVGGSPLPTTSFNFTVSPAGSFTVVGNRLTADGAVGSATLEAVPQGFSRDDVRCTAALENIGANTDGTAVRFFVVNDLTGEPVSGATVIIDANSDGLDDGGTAADPQLGGSYLATVSSAYTVTVFATGYNYISIVGLDPADSRDIVIPLAARAANPDAALVGGYTGRLGFEDFEKLFLSGNPKSIKFGLASTSFPLRSLLNFDLSLFVGTQAGTSCDSAASPGCYEVSIPGLYEGLLPLPGGVVIGLNETPIKPFIDAIGVHGQRYAWSLGGELELTELRPLIDELTRFMNCSCDTTDNACDTGCSCDSDCGVQINFGNVFNGLIPLFGQFAHGAKGNLPLMPVSKATWDTYIAAPYGTDRVQPTGDPFPVLDIPSYGGTHGRLMLRQAMSRFTDFTVAGLPADPVVGGGATMEGVLLLAGINTTGYGFVPMGIGAGLDCTEGDCMDRVVNPGGFDGVVNGGKMCNFDPGTDNDTCTPAVLALADGGFLPDGHLGLFSAKAHAGLSGEWITMAIAMPLSSLGDSDFRASAAILRNSEPAEGASSVLASQAYPAIPTIGSVNGRSYTPDGRTDYTVNWVTFARDVEGATSTRWNVFFKGGTSPGTFVAPVPATDDPFQGAGCPGNPTATCVNVTHLGFRTAGTTLDDLTDNSGKTLGNLVDDVTGFAARSSNVQLP